MRVLALMTDFYGSRGGIAEYNRFFMKALSEMKNIEEIVVLPRCSRQMRDIVASCHSRAGGNQQTSGSSIKTFEDDVTPTAEPTTLSLPPRRGEDDVTPTAEPTTLSLPPRRGEDDVTPTAEPTTLSLPPRGGEGDKKVTVLKEMPNKWQYSLSAIEAFMTKGPFDLIWCGHLYMAPLAALLSRMNRSQFWLQIHGVDAWPRPSKLIRGSLRRANLVLSVSRYSRKRFLEWSNIAPENVKVLPNTYDEKRFYPGVKNATLLKRFDGEGKKILLTVGRLAAGEMYKGHDTVIRILPELLKKDSSWIYWIAGEGDDRSRLQALTREMGVSRHVKFLGFIPEAQLPDLYRTADVFIMLSRGEGFGIVYLEAMACGLPVIAARGDGSADPLLDGRAGQLVDADSLDEVKNAIEQSVVKKADTGLIPKTFRYKNLSDHLQALGTSFLKTPEVVL